MDHLGVLDLRYGKTRFSEDSDAPSHSTTHGDALDLSISKSNNEIDQVTISTIEGCAFSLRPTVITPNQQFTPNRIISQRSRWNYRSHPSIDSDSSFESEQENDCTNSPSCVPPKSIDNVEALWFTSTGRYKRRISLSSSDFPDLSQTDTENDSEAGDSSLSLGFYKELPALTANVSIDKKRFLELSSCEAEIIDPEDIQSEFKSNEIEVEKNDDHDAQDSSLQETYLEELLSMQQNDSKKIKGDLSAGIQERAKKYIKEIRKTKSDMHVPSALNLEMDGTKKQLCVKCNDEFYSVAALLQHLMTHSSRNPGEKLIKCPVCTRRFSTLTTLEVHIQRLHTGDMKYVCQVCEAPFKFSTHLRKHMVTSRCAKGTKKSAQLSP